MQKFVEILKFFCGLVLLNAIPILVFMFVRINQEAGTISDTAALYQSVIFALAVCIVLSVFYHLYRSVRFAHAYFLEARQMPAARKAGWLLFYTALMLLAGEFVLPLMHALFGTPLDTENQHLLLHWKDNLPAAVFAADVVLVAPLMEEWLFRGVLLGMFGRALEHPAGKVLAAAVSALLFALIHGLGAAPLAVYGLMGLILAAAYLHFRDIRYPIAIHMANNALALFVIYYQAV